MSNAQHRVDFGFHQHEVCQGLIRHLEWQAGLTCADLTIQDVDGTTPPDARVELTFRLGNQLYAMEHTGIEPFDGFIAHQNRAAELFIPLETAVLGALTRLFADGTVIELRLPIDALMDMRLPEVRAIHSALTDWVCRTAPTLPPALYADYRGTLVTAQPVGVPFSVSLVRFDGVRGIPVRFQMKHVAPSGSKSRTARIERACEKKFPKLAAWKRSDRARTILILEDNDIQLTNHVIVAETFLPIARARTDRPDETYLVSTCNGPWCAWPILIGERSYFDFAAAQHPAHFQMDEHGQLIPRSPAMSL